MQGLDACIALAVDRDRIGVGENRRSKSDFSADAVASSTSACCEQASGIATKLN